MNPPIDTLLLLALPASGKSELRRYLASLDPEVALQDFGLGPTVQLDDYPYVHFMRRVDEELGELGAERVFFSAPDRPFTEGGDWATLIELINEDYAALGSAPAPPVQPTAWLLDRFDRARRAAGVRPPFDKASEEVHEALAAALDPEVGEMTVQRSATLACYTPGESTVLIEFARGGPEGIDPPLPAPHGYTFSLPFLAPDILRRATALHVWVEPEESRRRNVERALPGPEGDASILHHGVPEAVMRGNYGVDDFPWLLDQGGGDAIAVGAGDSRYLIPATAFDNRVDHTSFLRADPDAWDPDEVATLHAELKAVFDRLR